MSDQALGQAAAAAVERARAAWPELEVDEGRFVAALLARVDGAQPGEATDAALASLNVDDLYFAFACSEGDPAALALFESRFLPEVTLALAGAKFSSGAIDETLHFLRATLFATATVAPGEDVPAPKILGFSGRGKLRGWLQVTATRAAVRLEKVGRRALPLDDSLHAGPGDLELDYLRRAYGPVFQEAFREALAELPVADRLLLRQRFALHLTVTELGALHQVHHATISRRVIDARERLVATTRTVMMSRLRVGRAEVSSILRLIQSEVDITLSTHDAPPVVAQRA